MAIYDGMIGIAELMTNEQFLLFVESQEENILETTSTRDIWNRFQEFQKNEK